MRSSKHSLPIAQANSWFTTAAPPARFAPAASFSAPEARARWRVQPEPWKRALDLTCLILGLPGILVLMAAIAGFIKAVSPGPVLFKQERIGYRRRRFTCFKFRTMKVGADSAVHQKHLAALLQTNAPMVKMDAAGDPRLIPCGRFLRATGLDELPQLINVLRGEMSLVGPRPCTPYEFESYQPHQYGRFEALPGLTGLWQVNGKNKTTFTEMIRWDMQYAQRQSLWLDLKIMAATLSTVASQVRELTAKPARTR